MGNKVKLPNGYLLIGNPYIVDYPGHYAVLFLKTSYGEEEAEEIKFATIQEDSTRLHIDYRYSSGAIANSSKALKMILAFLIANYSKFPDRDLPGAAREVTNLLKPKLTYRITWKLNNLDILEKDDQTTLRIIAAALGLHKEAEQILP